MSPTPATRRTSSSIRVFAKLPNCSPLVAPLFEVSAMISRNPEVALFTRMPWRRTSSGRRCSTPLIRFWTFICAVSMSVLASNVTVIDAVPLA